VSTNRTTTSVHRNYKASLGANSSQRVNIQRLILLEYTRNNIQIGKNNNKQI